MDTAAVTASGVAPLDAGGLTAEVAAWCDRLDLASLPTEALTVVRHCVLDWLGVGLAGAGEPLVGILVDELARRGATSTLLGRRTRADVVQAALVNTASAHALDYDDTHMALPGHPTTPVLGGLLPVAEDLGLDGARFVRALVCGIEVELRLGRVAQPSHYERGWHATATLGTIGSALACAQALGATGPELRSAVGIAVSQAAGLKSMFGTMCKPTQVGMAASNGALAARLAHRGLSSNQSALEDPQGFLAAYGAPHDAAAARWDGDRLELLDTLFKYHASCYFTHASIDAARELRRQGVLPGDLAGIRVTINPANRSVCDIPAPRTGLEGKFSLRTTAAMALLGRDTSDPAGFTDAAMTEPDLVDLRERVEIEPDARLERTQSRVTVTTHDGRRRTAEADSGVPEADLERQETRLTEKFRRLAAPVLGAEQTEVAVALVGRLGDLGSIRELTAALVPPGADPRAP